MEQNAAATMPAMDSGKQNDGKGWKIATAIASVVAVCGIGFGVYGMMQSSQKDNQISDLKVQIKEDDGTVTTIETPEIETTTNDGTTVTITDNVVSEKVDSAKYLYVGPWGIKIAIPDSLKTVNYTYSAQDTLCLSGVKYHEGGMHYFPEFADVRKNTPGLSCVSRTLKDGYSPDDSPLEAYNYTVQGPQSVYDESDKDWEVESVQEIQKMLDISNFSKI